MNIGMDFPKLTAREATVLSLVVLGMSNKEIAAALGLKLQTIKLHVFNLAQKCGVSSRTQLAVYALTGYRPDAAAHHKELFMKQKMEVRMAKADNNDLAIVRGFIDYLNSIAERSEGDFLEGAERLQDAQASFDRVVLGYEVLRESFCDPDVSYLRFDPKIEAAARDRVLREAINAICPECSRGVPLADLPGYAHWIKGGAGLSSCDAAAIHELLASGRTP